MLFLNHFAPKIIISDFWFKLWMISENIIYSLIAASIFYFFLEVLPKVEAQKEFFLHAHLMQEKLVANLIFLKEILDSVPDSDNTKKIEEIIYNSDEEIPHPLFPIGDSNILCIIKGINKTAKYEAKLLQKLYGHLPKNITGIAIDAVMESIAKKSKLPTKGEISEIKLAVDLHLTVLASIEAQIIRYVSLTKK